MEDKKSSKLLRIRKSEADRISPLRDGSKVFLYEQAAEYYRKSVERKFAPDEIIFLLLIATPEKPIYGKTLLMKEAFLLSKEFLIQTNELQDPKFIGHKYGPHSFLLEHIIYNMEAMQLLDRKGKSEYSVYSLTNNGKKYAELSLEKLSSRERDELKKKRITWDELGIEGIKKLVYDNYRDYINNSVIKYKYRLVDWVKRK